MSIERKPGDCPEYSDRTVTITARVLVGVMIFGLCIVPCFI